MIHRMYPVVFVALMALPAGAQDRGVLAIDEEAGRYAFSFDSEADALNMCGTVGCEVVATFSACLAVAYSRVMIQQEQSVWTWIEADTEEAAGREALDECERSGGAACEVLNVYCAADSENSRAASTAGQQPTPATAPAQLPPEIEADRFLLQVETAIQEQDVQGAKTTIDRILELQAAHDLELPEQFSFQYAQVLERLGLYDEAMETVTRYLTRVGRAGEFYREALALLNDAESAKATSIEAAAEAARRPAGESRVFDGMEFVWVPAGEFRMGSTSSVAAGAERPVTQVRISRGYWLGKYEVTQAEWQGVMGTNPSEFSGCGQCPVENVSWNDAQEFIQLANAATGGNRYRLPTEAEWEYAARAGTTGDRYGNLDAIAWYVENSGDRTHPVGQKAPNAWGLHDMLGNVWEWVEDWGDDYPGGVVTDPRGPVSGSVRVFRGGGFARDASDCRSSYRSGAGPRYDLFLGFRLLRTE